jgi:hypothetical protein
MPAFYGGWDEGEEAELRLTRGVAGRGCNRSETTDITVFLWRRY